MPTTQADGWRAVQAGPDDKSVLKNLLLDSPIKHQHLDWFQSQDLLDREPFIFAYLDDMPVGGLACPPEPIETAWLRLFFTSRAASPHNVWASTWPQAMQSAIEQGTTRFAALIFDPWFRNILSEEGFVESNTVVFLEWETVEGFPPPVRDLALRGMRPQDIELLTSLDHQAFAQIWRHTSDALREGLRQSSYATVALDGDRLVGYQISTSSIFGAHLARLAVEPAYRRKGIAEHITRDLMHHFAERGFARISVNTQIDNEASLRLYEKLGFAQTGQEYPVFTLDA